jgi:hypothetical protein
MTCDCKKPLACVQVSRCLKDYVEAPPQSWEDLCNRQAWNTETSGMFLDTTMHLPCPGCGAKDFMRIRIADGDAQYERGGVCRECERGFRMPIQRAPNSIGFSIVQTSGPDLPPWFKMAIPRDRGRQ